AAIAAAAVLDRWSYSGEEWQRFRELDPVLTLISDFRGDGYLKQHPDIMTRYGYSPNDIDLLRFYFLADPQIADPKSLSGMLAELGALPLQPRNMMLGYLLAL